MITFVPAFKFYTSVSHNVTLTTLAIIYLARHKELFDQLEKINLYWKDLVLEFLGTL